MLFWKRDQADGEFKKENSIKEHTCRLTSIIFGP